MDKPRTVPPTPHLHPSMQSKDGFNHYKSHSYNQLKSFIPQPKSALVTSHESSPSTSNLESRARNIILSNIPIQESKNGRVRVIRQNQNIQPVDQTEPDSLISQHEPLASSLESSKDNYSPKIVEPIGFMRSVKHVNTGYSYKPPAAAKYYLWDSSRIGHTITLKSDNLIPTNVKISSTALKQLKIELLKRNLLKSANTGNDQCPTVGFLIGQTVCNNQDVILDLNRFDTGIDGHGSKSLTQSDLVNPEVLVHVTDTSTQNSTEFSDYDRLFTYYLKALSELTVSEMRMRFPLVGLFQIVSNSIVPPLFRTVIPSLEIELYPINPIRVVNTALSNKLMSEPFTESLEFGILSIDQARQLYLLNLDDPISQRIPLIGLWLKTKAEITDPLIHTLCLKFILHNSLKKLDTGKNTILLCCFQPTDPSRPICFECTYKSVNDIGIEVFGSKDLSSKPFQQLDLLHNVHFVDSYNKHFKGKLVSHLDESVVTSDESIIKSILIDGNEHEMQFQDLDVSVNTMKDNHVSSPVEKQALLSQEIDKSPESEKIMEEIADSPKLGAPFEFNTPFNHMSADSSMQQMMYISMLQQQVASLQAQVLHLSQQCSIHGFYPLNQHSTQFGIHPQHNFQSQHTRQNSAENGGTDVINITGSVGGSAATYKSVSTNTSFLKPDIVDNTSEEPRNPLTRENIFEQENSKRVNVLVELKESQFKNIPEKEKQVAANSYSNENEVVANGTQTLSDHIIENSINGKDVLMLNKQIRSTTENLQELSQAKNEETDSLHRPELDDAISKKQSPVATSPNLITTSQIDDEFDASLASNFSVDCPAEYAIKENISQEDKIHDIIASLVSDAEQSFIYNEKPLSNSETTTVFPKKPSRKVLPKSGIKQQESFKGTENFNQTIESEPLEESLSFATMKYLEKYGLN